MRRHSLSIGAFVMILSVTMGPSLQSLITTYGAYNEGNSYPNSTIGGAYSLDGGSAIISEVSGEQISLLFSQHTSQALSSGTQQGLT